MLYSAIVAICLASTPVPDCQRETAQHWIGALPEPQQGLGMCALYAQQLIAETALITHGTYPKVWCRPLTKPENVG